ncbi:11911_t:CDS:2, partial [Rhizophagus irregularis]
AEALDVAESTVGYVVADWNKHNNGTFTSHKTLGWPKFQTDDDVSELLHTKILNFNKTAKQVFYVSFFLKMDIHFLSGSCFSNAEEWNDVPDVVKDANIILNQMDYYGNFNAEIFEDFFSTLCETLHEKYGLVNIHMDGASYHKRRVENIPTLSTKKQEIVEWLTARNISFSNEL